MITPAPGHRPRPPTTTWGITRAAAADANEKGQPLRLP
jgi:hypothetical protein